jgi:heme-degrading monooxygenase HmoA
MGQPYHCVANRLRLRGPRHLPAFLRASLASAAAARSTPGNVRVRLLGLPPLRTYLTLTVWEDEEAVRRFLEDPRHQDAAAHMDQWASEGCLVRFASPTRRVGWRTALRRLRSADAVHHEGAVAGAPTS